MKRLSPILLNGPHKDTGWATIIAITTSVVLLLTHSSIFCAKYFVKNVTNSNITATLYMANQAPYSFDVHVQSINGREFGRICLYSVVVVAKDDELRGQRATYVFDQNTCQDTTVVARKADGKLQLTIAVTT